MAGLKYIPAPLLVHAGEPQPESKRMRERTYHHQPVMPPVSKDSGRTQRVPLTKGFVMS
jgi:hypothetical protein